MPLYPRGYGVSLHCRFDQIQDTNELVNVYINNTNGIYFFLDIISI